MHHNPPLNIFNTKTFHKARAITQLKIYGKFLHTSPIEPTVTNCDISDNNSELMCVIADITGK